MRAKKTGRRMTDRRSSGVGGRPSASHLRIRSKYGCALR
jgi:hypothetical protein